MDDPKPPQLFRFFTEVGIIAQFAAALIERHLPERVTHQHFGLLGHLSRRPDGATPQQLAFAFQIPKTSMTHMIRVLEDLGLVQIAPNHRDARSKLVRITDQGLAQLKATLARAAQDIAAMDPPLDQDLVSRSLATLEPIRIQLDAARTPKR